MNYQLAESRKRRTTLAMKRLNKGINTLEKRIGESLNRALKLMKKGIKPLMSNWKYSEGETKSIHDYDSGELETVMEKMYKGMSNTDEERFETFGEMTDRLIKDKNKEINQKINKGVNTMSNKEIILGTALELCRENKLSDSDLIKIEARLNKGAPLKEEWAELIKAKLGRRGYDAEYDEGEEESNPDHLDEDELGEEEEEVKSKKRKAKSEAEHEGNMKSEILDEVTLLCKSNKITLDELIVTESCLEQDREIPERVANLIGIEYVEKSDEFDDDFEELEKADTVSEVGSHTSPSQITSHARGGDKLDETEAEFNEYFFDLTIPEALSRITDLHIAGKLSTMDVIKLEGRIRKGIEPPKEMERFFKKGNWLE